MLLGLALYNSVHLDIKFPDLVYKKLLQKTKEDEIGLGIVEDLKEIDPDIYKTLKFILQEKGSLSELELYFNI